MSNNTDLIVSSPTVDVTTKAAGDHKSDRVPAEDAEIGSLASASGAIDHADHSNGSGSSSIVTKFKNKAFDFTQSLKSSTQDETVIIPAMPQKLAQLVAGYKASDQAKITEAELHRLHHGVGLDGLREVTSETTPFRTYKRASWSTQFVTLRSRAFKNLYR